MIVHDPQPVGLIDHFPDSKARWIWRGHIDFSTPNQEVLDFLLPSIGRYDASVFHLPEYVPTGMQPRVRLAAGDRPARAEEHGAVVGGRGIHRRSVRARRRAAVAHAGLPVRSLEDPLGVIDAYRLVKAEVPDVQLALVGSMAHDDPEGVEYYNRTLEYADGDPDIYILSNLNNVGSVEVNAFQVNSRVVLQKSIREGFGLTVSEALWKARPTVAGNVGGIRVRSWTARQAGSSTRPRSAPPRVSRCSSDPAEARVRALHGKEHVRQHFLTPRLLRDWLVLFNRLLGHDTAGAEVATVVAA